MLGGKHISVMTATAKAVYSDKTILSYNYITEDIFQLYTSGGSRPVSAELLPEINRDANGLFSTV